MVRADWWLVGGGLGRFLRLYRAGLFGEDRVSNCGLRARATIGRQTRFVVASEETYAQWSQVAQSIVATTAAHHRREFGIHALYVRQSGLDVDNMSAKNDIRTTRMHRMARRTV